MDKNFTLSLKEWLDTPAESRDIALGAHLLLRLTANRIQYANILRSPEANAEYLAAQIQKYYDFRVLSLTHEQVMEMQRQATSIAEAHDLDSPQEPAPKPDADKSTDDRDNPQWRGRRPDHDSLPDEIKALWTENFSILQRMRECHVSLRMLTLTDHPCPDSERYPFLKEMISLDKKLHSNWHAYDMYRAVAENAAQPAADVAAPSQEQ